jgi:hypothetical protein
MYFVQPDQPNSEFPVVRYGINYSWYNQPVNLDLVSTFTCASRMLFESQGINCYCILFSVPGEGTITWKFPTAEERDAVHEDILEHARRGPGAITTLLSSDS